MCEDVSWQAFINKAIEKEASDIHLTVGQRPHMRCDGVLEPMEDRPLTEPFMVSFCAVIMDEAQRERLTREKDMDLSWSFAGRRFRVNAYYQQGVPALAIRLLPERIPSLAEIGAPKAWQKMKGLDQGLILVTGRTGSGKTTTLAAFIEALNQEKSYHIITLEKINTKDMIQMYGVSRSTIILGALSVLGVTTDAWKSSPIIIDTRKVRHCPCVKGVRDI